MTVGYLKTGTRLALSGKIHTVDDFDAAKDVFTLVDFDGVELKISQPDLVRHPNLMLFESAKHLPDRGLVERLDKSARQRLDWRVEHLHEVQCGFRSGNPDRALPDEPKPAYDPATTTLTQRRYAKAAELDTESARRSGETMSYGTLKRLGPLLAKGEPLDAIMDKRATRRSPGRTSMHEVVEKACWAVLHETRTLSNLSEKTRYFMIKEKTSELLATAEESWAQTFAKKPFPSPATVRRWHRERLTKSQQSGKARTRATATTAPKGGWPRTPPTRVGEQVYMDSNSLDLLLKGTGYEGAVQGVLVAAMDAYSRSIVSVRVVETAETAIDVSVALLDMSRPMPLKPGWGDAHRWPFVGVPDAVIGPDASARPIAKPETLVLDHGGGYKAHLTVGNAEALGISVLPARIREGADKGLVERFFGTLSEWLLSALPGYRGSDVSERGVDVEAAVTLTAQELEDLILFWSVTQWQNHLMTTVRPPWCPEGDWSPNLLYQHSIDTNGLTVRYADANSYASVLDATFVKITQAGIVVKGLTYDHASLNALRGTLPPYERGKKGSKWTVRYDKRNLNSVWLLAPTMEYIEIPWIGSRGNMPAFTDRNISAARKARGGGNALRTYTDEEIREILLTEVLRVQAPETSGSTEGSSPAGKKAGKRASSNARKAQMAAADRAAHGAPVVPDESETDAAEEKERPDPLTAGRRAKRQSAPRPTRPAPPMSRRSFLGNLATDDEIED